MAICLFRTRKVTHGTFLMFISKSCLWVRSLKQWSHILLLYNWDTCYVLLGGTASCAYYLWGKISIQTFIHLRTESCRSTLQHRADVDADASQCSLVQVNHGYFRICAALDRRSRDLPWLPKQWHGWLKTRSERSAKGQTGIKASEGRSC